MPLKSFSLSALPDWPFWSRIGVPDNRLIQRGLTLVLAACLIRFIYNRFLFERTSKFPSQNPPAEEALHPIERGQMASAPEFKGLSVKQPFKVFLVLDIEGTCEVGTDFNYPNEIIVRAMKSQKKHVLFYINHPRNCLFVCCVGRIEQTTAEQARSNLLTSSEHLFDPRGNQCSLHFVHN